MSGVRDSGRDHVDGKAAPTWAGGNGTAFCPQDFPADDLATRWVDPTTMHVRSVRFDSCGIKL